MYNDFLKSLDRELVRGGLWGPSSEKIKEDLHDHFVSKKEALLAQGLSAEESERQALHALGTPAEVAREAGRQLSRSSWFRRQSWLSAALLPFLLGLCLSILIPFSVLFLIQVLGIHHSRSPHSYDDTNAFIWSQLGWSPWLVAVFMLTAFIHYFPLGWRRLSLTAPFFALGTTLVSYAPFVITPGAWALLPFIAIAYLIGGEPLCHDLGFTA